MRERKPPRVSGCDVAQMAAGVDSHLPYTVLQGYAKSAPASADLDSTQWSQGLDSNQRYTVLQTVALGHLATLGTIDL